MTQQSEQIPVEDDYLRALGRATYNFAYLECGIVWLTETMQKDFLNQASTLTAGQIGKRFSSEVENLDDDAPDKVRLRSLACDFKQIVIDRNKLMHGNPHTAQTDEQRLWYDGKHGCMDWTIDAMTQFATRTATASIEAGNLLHSGRLEQYYAANP